MQHLLESHPYIQKLLALNEQLKDRKEFHTAVQPLLKVMGEDKDFIAKVVERNLLDEGYLNQKWSLYNIPFFYIYENADFNLKIHLFVPLESKEAEKAASCIHHHNNYMLSSFAMHGSGYESYLFQKEFDFDEKDKTANFKITKHFHQTDWPVSFVDAWEPHLVFNPTKLSATLILWSPDKKRATDNLRQNPILKPLKKPLRKVINALGLGSNVGIASQKTYQFYPEGGKIKGILEDDYFEPTRKAVGKKVDEYSIQTVFRFLQETQGLDKDFLIENRDTMPDYYQPFIEQYLEGKEIEETFAKAKINIPAGGFTKQEVLEATHG